MNKSLHFSVMTVGVYASVLSFLHGLFEMFQGFTQPDQIFIYAINHTKPEHEMWHGNFPAMTIIPNYFISGFLVSLLSLILIFYLVRKQRYSIILLLLAPIVLLLIGGGFVPPFLLIVAGLSSIRINKPFKSSKKQNKGIGLIWIVSIIVLPVWAMAEWIIGYYYNSVLVSISTFLFLLGIILPIFIIVMGALNDKINGGKVEDQSRLT